VNKGVEAMGNEPLLAPLVSPDQLSLVLGDERVRIFDATVFLVREVHGGPYMAQSGRAHYEEAHLPGASFADIPGELSDPGSPFRFTVPSAAHFAEAAGRLGIGNAHHVVAYTQESPTWATRLWWLLRYFGHDHVSVLDGGRAAWAASGRPLERGAARYPETTFTAHPRPELLATLDEVKEIAGGAHPEPTQLVNALPREAFLGEVPGSYSRPGRIPTSVNLPSSSLLDRTNRFLPSAELDRAFGEAEVAKDEPLVAYCGGGISATVDLFALFLTGSPNARLYDGSLSEWSADPLLPLVTG
jgi:thiosulfate/3-mercaptopyruvate sulfurtransferase